MLDYSLLHWTTFLTAAVLLNLSPGPDIAFILGQTIRGGRPAGVAAMFGIWAGAFVHVLMAAIGLSAIIATSVLAFLVVKWLGVIYLVWLGIKALRSKGEGLLTESSLVSSNPWEIYRQGVLVAILNPKVAIFFLAFLPQFVVEGAGPVWMQLFLHGSLIIVVAAFVEPPLVMAGAKLATGLKSSRVGKWLDRGLCFLFIALGIRLAISEHS